MTLSWSTSTSAWTTWKLSENTGSLCISQPEDLAKEELMESSGQASVGLYPSLDECEAAVGQYSQPSRWAGAEERTGGPPGITVHLVYPHNLPRVTFSALICLPNLSKVRLAGQVCSTPYRKGFWEMWFPTWRRNPGTKWTLSNLA